LASLASQPHGGVVACRGGVVAWWCGVAAWHGGMR